MRAADGAFTTFDVLGTGIPGTFVRSINREGAVTGYYVAFMHGRYGITRGFVRTPDGAVTKFKAPGNSPARKSVTRIPVRFDGSIWSPIWIGQGRIAALGARFASSMWHYHPVKER